MPIRIADIYANLSVKTDDYDRGLSAAQGKAGTFSNVLQGIFQGVGQRLFSGLVNGIETFVSKVGGAIQASSDLNESINKTGVVFGSSAQQVLEWSQTSDKALGLSQQKALEAASSFGALFVQMGQGREKAAQMSEGLLQIAADLGSINNLDPSAVFVKLKAGLAGESEPLKSLNIFLNEHNVAQKAVQLGLAASTDSVNEQAKVMARYSLIVEQSKATQGDFARTSGDLANAQRILAAELKNGSAKLGNTFRPALTAITNELIAIAPQFFGYGQNIMDQLANGLAAGIRAILPVITVVRQLLAYWFAPGSPPRVAPDIDKWGAAAMQQFIGGFTAVDVKGAMQSIGSALEQILRSDVAAGKADEGGLVSRVIGSRNAIAAAVAEFRQVGTVAQSTIDRIARTAGSSGGAVASLVKSYFDLQKATDAVNRAQSQLNSITERYDAIISPLQSQLDGVRAEQQKLADQQRLIAAKNVLASFDSTAADKRAAQLEIEQISLEQQIAGAEQKKQAETDAAQSALDGAKKQQDAAQKQVDIAQATIDQQVQINNLLGEQRQLEERLAAQREADAKRAQAEAEQAANKAKQEAEQAQRLADQLHQAQLQYNLELADTPGKIKLMEAELSRTKVGSVEYYQILTQIHQLQEQYNKELERAAKQAGDLANGDIATGIDGNITAPLGEASKAGQNLANALKEAFGPLPAASNSVKDLADKISALVSGIAKLLGVDLSAWTQGNQDATEQSGAAWDHYGERVAAANAGVKTSTDNTVANITTFVDIVSDLINGNWAAAWEKYQAYAIAAYGATDTETETKLKRWQYLFDLFQYTTNLTWSKYWADLQLIWTTATGAIATTVEGWFTSLTAKFSQWYATTNTSIAGFFTGIGTKFYNGGANIISSFWDGLKSKWGEVETWFTDKLQSLRNQLPFSEPKDPSSPLRGLSKSGAAMVGMLQSGIAQASLNIEPLANALLPQQAAPVTNNSSSTSNVFNINIYGATDAGSAKQGARDGILEALRATGLA